MSNDDNCIAVVLEEIRDRNKVILETLGLTKDNMEALAAKEDPTPLKLLAKGGYL